MTYQAMPERVDWSLLITLLNRTYEHGDGGLHSDTDLYPTSLSRIKAGGVYKWDHGVVIWNTAVRRLSDADIERCILIDEPLDGGLVKRERVA